MHLRALNSVSMTGFEHGVCVYNAEPRLGLLGKHTSAGRSHGSPSRMSDPMAPGVLLCPQPYYRFKANPGSLSPVFCIFRTGLYSGFDANSLPLRMEETVQLSTRQSTNANAVYELVHGAYVNSACSDSGTTNLDTFPFDWEGQLGFLNVTSLPALGFVLLSPGRTLVNWQSSIGKLPWWIVMSRRLGVYHISLRGIATSSRFVVAAFP